MALVTFVMTACDDTTDNIGSSLTPSVDRLNVKADTFNVASASIIADSISARNTTGYLGRVKDPETGDIISASFMTQFHTLEGYNLPTEDSISSRDADGNIIADSCEIELTFTSYYGDSLSQMKTRVYCLDEPMEEGAYYSTNYDPIKEGKINVDGFHQDLNYTLDDQSVSDSLKSTSDYTKNIRVKLTSPFTKDGITYNNFGSYLLRQYYAHPEYFHSNYDFIHKVMPGFYFKNTGGIGSMVYVNTPLIAFYFKYKVKSDSIVAASTSFAGTEEVLQTTTFSNDKERIQQLAADNSCTYLKTPSGLYTELTLPVTEIMNGHENDTVNTARINIPRLVNQNPTDYSLSIPQSLIMLPEDSLYSFFANNRLPDYKTSFISTYSSGSNSYTFGNISGIINAMYNSRLNGNTSPNWNKVVIVPINLETTTSSSNQTTIVNVSADMSLTSTRLLGGRDNPDALKMTVIYSKFNAE